MIRTPLVFVALLLSLASGFDGAPGQTFFGHRSHLMVSGNVRTEVQDAVNEILGQGHGVDIEGLQAIKAYFEPTFHALPKNKMGHVSSSVMKHAVHRYFNQRHGWVVKGFEPQTTNSTDLQQSTILTNKLPDFVEAVLEKRLAHEGFSLGDIVTIAAVVELLITNEESKAIETAFNMHDVSVYDKISTTEMLDIVYSYFLIQLIDGSTNNKTSHFESLRNIRSIYPYWDLTKVFVDDLVLNSGFRKGHTSNPFRTQMHTFEDAFLIARHISEEFGPWSNHECKEMRDTLLVMDPFARGRVKLADFYRSSIDGGWQFHESSQYLKSLGALDESSPTLGPQVIIPNYILGMSNCITSTPFYSVCCLNECNELLHDVEDRLRRPSAPYAVVAEAVSDLSTSTTEPRNISGVLLARLEQIALHNGGVVPLHGRLFAQWMHFAFPRECPYPHATDSVNPLTQEEFESIPKEVSDDEVQQHITSRHADQQISQQLGESAWDLREELLTSATPSDQLGNRVVRFAGMAGRMMAGIGMCVIFGVSVLQMWAHMQQTSMAVARGHEKVLV